MTHSNHLTTPSIHRATMGKRMLQGAAIAFLVITIFLLGIKNPDPAWGKYWMIRPLIIVPLAGAMGGAFYYFMDQLRSKGGWVKVFAVIAGIIGYIIALWMGSILGLDGTLWD